MNPPTPPNTTPEQHTPAQLAGKVLIGDLINLVVDAQRRGKRVVGVKQIQRILDTFQANGVVG